MVRVAAVVGVLTAGCAAPDPTASARFAVAAGGRLVLSPAQLLAATGGATPVGFGKPAHGRLDYGPRGAMVYRPDPGFTGTDDVVVTTTTAVHVYAADSPPIAIVGGVEVQDGSGSAIAYVPGATDRIYGLTDRGPYADGRSEGEKVIPVSDFNPHITEFQLSEGTAVPRRTIALADAKGRPMDGLINAANPTHETTVALDGTVLAPSDHGLDPEGMVAAPDGTFWVSDEYGPYLTHFDGYGRQIERLSPLDASLPRELALRSPNQGLEGLTITPDGSTLVAIMQSALKTPGLDGSAKKVPFTRIVTVNLADKRVAEYVYPLANPRKSGVAVSEITAISATTFLVDERDGKFEPGADKKIYVADISDATDIGPNSQVPGAAYRGADGGLLIDGKPLESLIGVASDSDAGEVLARVGIRPAGKTLKLDLGGLLTELNSAGMFFGHDRIEGMATPDGGSTIVLSNDSDFGLLGLGTAPQTLEPKTLPNGRQDSEEFLVVDTTKLPPRTETRTISVQVG